MNWWAYFQDDGLDRRRNPEGIGLQSETCSAAAARIEIAAVQERHHSRSGRLTGNKLGRQTACETTSELRGLALPRLVRPCLEATHISECRAGLQYRLGGGHLEPCWGTDKLAADATLEAREADREAARLSLSGQVAKAWFADRGVPPAGRQIETASDILEHTCNSLPRTDP